MRELADRLDLPLNTEWVDVPSYSQRERLSLETAARELRYGFFRRLLEEGSCDKIATAHSLDDQAETVLLRLLRGTGTHGVAAIPPMRGASRELSARIVRPLLGTRRDQVERYLQSLHQAWREDSSNQDMNPLRNRIRHELLPMLERDYNKALRRVLTSFAEIARAEEELWAEQISNLAAIVAEDRNTTAIHLPQFLATPLALQRRLLLEIFERRDIPVSFEAIDLVLQVAAWPRKRCELGGGWTASASKSELVIRKTLETKTTAGYSFDLSVPGIVTLPNGVSVRATVVEDAASPGTLLAYARLQFPLRVRNWQPGDRYWPFGSKQAEKLKRLFSERRIAAGDRHACPVVWSGDEIVWVRGFPVASEFVSQAGKAVLIEIA